MRAVSENGSGFTGAAAGNTDERQKLVRGAALEPSAMLFETESAARSSWS
jgi:hypothetical protein